MALGIIYWAVWRIVLPKIFGYELVLNKVVLDDGTVVNVVGIFSVIILFFFGFMTDHLSVFNY